MIPWAVGLQIVSFAILSSHSAAAQIGLSTSFTAPGLPINATAEMRKRNEEATMHFFYAQCELLQSLASAGERDFARANAGVAEARQMLAALSQQFSANAEQADSMQGSNPEDTDEVRRARSILEDNRIEVPVTFSEAYNILVRISEEANDPLSDVRFFWRAERY